MITKFHKDWAIHIKYYNAYVYRITIIFPDGRKKFILEPTKVQYMIHMIFQQKIQSF